MSQNRTYGWGDNRNGQIGIDNGYQEVNTQPLVINRHIFEKISAGLDHSLGINQNQELYAWGSNSKGQLGNTAIINVGDQTFNPILVGNSYQKISAGKQCSFGLKNDGQLFAWGFNNNVGVLGIGTTGDENIEIPASVVGDHKFIDISTNPEGSHCLGLKANGQLYSWGWNNYGQLGVGTTGGDTGIPTLVPGITFEKISAGGEHSLGLKSNGDLYAWGSNRFGQLGNNQTNLDGDGNTGSPTLVVGYTFDQISAGAIHNLALGSTGQIFSWGNNDGGELGQGSDLSGNSGTPMPILYIGQTFKSISTGSYHSFGITDSDQLWAWGINGHGLLGIGSTMGLTAVPTAILGYTFSNVSGGSGHSLGIGTKNVQPHNPTNKKSKTSIIFIVNPSLSGTSFYDPTKNTIIVFIGIQ